MLVICNGQPKSGSSFIHQLVDGLSENAGHDQQALRSAYLPGEYIPYPPHPHFVNLPPDGATRIVTSMPSSDLMVIKTHCSLTEELLQLIRQGEILALCSYREPRDAAVALADAASNESRLDAAERRFHGIESYLDAILVTANRTHMVMPWLTTEEVLKISFTELSQNPFGLLHRLQAWLGLNSGDDTVLLQLLRKRASIREYNIGLAGRHHTNLTCFEEGLCNQLFHSFDQVSRSLEQCGATVP